MYSREKKIKEKESSNNSLVFLSSTKVQTNLQSPLRYLQLIKDSIHKAWNLQNSREAVAMLVSSETVHRHDLDISSMYCMQGLTFVIDMVRRIFCRWGLVKCEHLLFSVFCLIWTQESASSACWKQQFGLWHHFFLTLLSAVVGGEGITLISECRVEAYEISQCSRGLLCTREAGEQ